MQSGSAPPAGGSPPNAAPPGVFASTAASTGGSMARLLSILAVAISVIAVVLAVVLPGAPGAAGKDGTNGTNGATGPQGSTGPQGPAGATGSRGPAGPGSLMNSSSTTATTTILSTCTQYAGGNVTLTVPAAGHVVVQAMVWMLIDHTQGTVDEGYVTIWNSTGPTCGLTASYWVFEIPAEDANGTYPVTGAPMITFTATTAGTSTYYIVGAMTVGQDSLDRYWYANMDAVYYPS